MAPSSEAGDARPSASATVAVRVWDAPTRAFHWTLVALVAFSGLTGNFADDLSADAMDWHLWSGFAILALLLFRLVWGVVGSTYARFANFVRGPRALIGYAAEIAGLRPARAHIGHNPLGGWSVVLMLGCLLLQTGSGLFLSDDDLGVEAPLSKYVSGRLIDALADFHEENFEVLMLLVGIHLAAIAFYRVVKRENLILPMISGRKHLPAHLADRAARGGPLLLALALAALAATAVWLLVTRL